MPDAPGNSKSIWGFDPRSIPGCQVWLDATDSNTITYSSGSNVSLWKDKAPYGNYARQLQGTPTRVASAINGLPAMYLDGPSATQAAFTGTCPPNVTNQLTAFAVFTVQSGVDDAGRLLTLNYPDYNNPNAMMPLGYRTTVNSMRVERNGAGYDGTTNAVPYGLTTLAACTTNGTATTVHVNGTQVIAASTVGSNFGYTYYTIGCFANAVSGNSYRWKGYVGELILYSNALSTSQRQQVEGYLTKKWSVGLNSPIFTSPSSISNLRLWIDAQDATTVTTSAGLVTNVRDKSSNNWTLTGANGFSYPNYTFNNGTYPSFYGSNPSNAWSLGSNASLTFTQPFTVFFVGARLNLATATNWYDGYMFDGLNSTNRCFAYGNYYLTGSLGGAAMTVNRDTVNPIVITTVLNTVNSSQYLNGTTFSSNVSGGLSNLSSGIRIANSWNTNSSWVGHFCEMVVYSGLLTTLQRQQVEYYLANKWGLLTRTTFAPNNIPGCTFWLDAADATSITGTYSSITGWNDKSGQLRNMTPVGAVSYTGTSVNMVGTAYVYVTSAVDLTNCTVFAVGSIGSGSIGNVFLAGRGASLPSYRSYDGLQLIVDSSVANTTTMCGYFGASGSNIVNTGITTTNSNIYSYTLASNGAMASWTNGTTGNTATYGPRTASAGGFAINAEWTGSSYGTYSTANTRINEIIVYTRILTTAERQQVEYYLSQKWAISGPPTSTFGPPQVSTAATSTPYLPSTHPFYSMSPYLRPFSPTDIDGGCSLWLDAADATTLSPSGVGTGSNVTQWNDKSGNNYHAVGYNNTATYTASGLNGLPALTFSSTKSMVSPVPAGTFPTALSAFVVYQFSGAASPSPAYTLINRTFSSGSAFAAPFSLYQNNGSIFRYIGSGTQQITSSTTGTTYTTTTPSIYYFSIASNANTTWNESVNGVPAAYTLASGTAGYADTASNVCIGGRLDTAVYMNGVISEVIMYNSTLTSAQRQQVETYLIRKWGIPMPTIGVSSTTPSLTNCKLWLDGADILGTGAPAPTTITTWADKSGTGNTVTANGQAIASTPMGPFMTRACYFSITGGLVGSIVNTPFVIFVVETSASIAGPTNFFFGNDTIPATATDNALHIGYRNNGQQTFAFYADDLETVRSFPAGFTLVWAFYLPTASNRNTRLNGSLVSTHTNYTRLGTLSAPVIGRVFGNYNDAYCGTISEILIYNTDIGLSAIQTIESYLIAKWQPGTLVPKFTIPADVALPFSPLQISGCRLWLDGNDPAGTGLQPASGALTTWADKSGSNNNMTAVGTAPTFSNAPPGAVTFGGAGYYSNASSMIGDIYTAFFVYKQTGGGPLYTTGATSGSNGLFPNEGGTTYFTRGDSTWYTTSSPFACNVVNLAVVNFSSNIVGGAQSLYYNGSNVVTTTQANTITYTNLLIGSRQSGGVGNITGTMYEVIGYAGNMTTDQRQRVEGYLAQKWKF